MSKAFAVQNEDLSPHPQHYVKTGHCSSSSIPGAGEVETGRSYEPSGQLF